MWVEHIEPCDPIISIARILSAGSADECFSASEVANFLKIAEIDVLRALSRLEETDWVVRYENDWSTAPTAETRWVVREHASLTVGRLYEVLGIEADWFRILDDFHDPVLFHPSCFKVIDDSEPTFWTWTTGDDGERYGYPPEWARTCFFEKYHDRVKTVREQFWKDLRERYPATWSEHRASP